MCFLSIGYCLSSQRYLSLVAIVLYLSLYSACEVYWDCSVWKWLHRIFLAVKGCAWRYLVQWGQAVCQNCCWFPKHLLMFASSVPWSSGCCSGPTCLVPGRASPSLFPLGTVRDAGGLTAADPVPAQLCRSAAAFPLTRKRQPAPLCVLEAGEAESNVCRLPV